jgi:hypothetical protein
MRIPFLLDTKNYSIFNETLLNSLQKRNIAIGTITTDITDINILIESTTLRAGEFPAASIPAVLISKNREFTSRK